MRSPLSGIRWKIIALFFLSMVLSMFTVVVLYVFAIFTVTRHIQPFSSLLQLLDAWVGAPVVFALTGIVFFVFYVVLLSRGTVKYLVEITRGVQQLSHGNFDLQIPVKSNDELGNLAENINWMARRLQSSIAEERLAVQAKNELITNVSHDLRTPLTSMIGYLRLIEEDRYRDEVELRYYVNIAYEKTRRLYRLVEDLFEYTRVSYGQVRLELSPINLVELLGQLAAEYSLQLRDSQMEIQLAFCEEKVMITADGDKLMRVFENLIANAIKYGREGKRVEIAVSRENDMVVIDVVNYGDPIPATDLPHLFERFYRVEKSRSEETGGTGLGLAIAKSMIELHQGSITVSSSTAKTVFRVKLPVNLSEVP
ncbi:sensor histidine kinase [Brevibacillus massiliensis]|jgi:signal transduction histidine kinase|uniref:sensor histidine kinase n=1 Tax=Brevibacillus massiliensis TaxID=1118054 RepID=UPI00035EA7CE|nr:HAMP domain-containing sensor histidine kinase [Brevibacillus massiliensis]